MLKENENFIYNFINKELRFLPSCDASFPFLPFAINRPFAVYDISKMTNEQTDALYELAPTALANCLPIGHQLYFIDWFHKFILYDPRNPKNSECADEETLNPDYNCKGIAHFDGFYPNGDYYFYIEKYGCFGYLSHPWRKEVWIYGEELVKEFEKIEDKIGFIKKAVLK